MMNSKAVKKFPFYSAHIRRKYALLFVKGLRNRLISSTLDSLVRATMNGPEVNEFNPIPVSQLWESKGKRKIVVSVSHSSINTSDTTDTS